MLRTCKKCGETKEIEEFVKNKESKDGYRHDCKMCIKKYRDEYYALNKIDIINKTNAYRKQHLSESNKYTKKYRISNKAKIAIIQKTWNENNKDHKKQLNREWAAKNKIKRCESTKKHNLKYPEQLKKRNKKYQIELPNSIIMAMLKHSDNISYETIKNYPELIELKRTQIQLLRLTKE